MFLASQTGDQKFKREKIQNHRAKIPYPQLRNELSDGADEEEQIEKEFELIEEANWQKGEEVVFLIVYLVRPEFGDFPTGKRFS